MAKANKVVNTKQVMNKQEVFNRMESLVRNSLIRRYDLIQTMLSPGRDIDTECHYPTTITKANYRKMYDRFGVASRVVEILPEECWAQEPWVYEVEDARKTEFENAWDEALIRYQLFHYMNRIDVLSGIGQYGLLLFGIGDGKDLDKPVEGIDIGTGLASKQNSYPLLYMRTFDESVVEIEEKETNSNNPRYGFPTMYSIEFEDESMGMKTKKTRKVHWTRVLHVADNKTSSEVYGTPRLQRVYNTLLDLRKVLAGSGEMFWKGGFPGLAFKLSGDDGLQEVSDAAKTTMKDNIEEYFAGLQRAILLENVDVKPIEPQVADPTGHIEMQTKAIAISLGIPYRIFQGSEEAKQASTQDKRVWNERIMKRQRNYLTPMLVRPFVDRLMAYGVLPQVDKYIVEWPDREAITDKDIADVAVKETQAMKEYVQGDCSLIMGPDDFFTSILKKSAEEAKAFSDGVQKLQGDEDVSVSSDEPSSDIEDEGMHDEEA